ncbi:MAG: hypothetical protein KGQ54_04330 [Verrucomicrobia bacterium]|nr:hypothetical protein [Verrucomicrobiota bacterium]
MALEEDLLSKDLLLLCAVLVMADVLSEKSPCGRLLYTYEKLKKDKKKLFRYASIKKILGHNRHDEGSKIILKKGGRHDG